MARLSIIVCDLCRTVSNEELPYSLTLQKGRGKGKEVVKAEICSTCFSSFVEKIESDFDINQLPQNKTPKVLEKKVIAEGETVVPSNIDNITEIPSEYADKCPHNKTSFEPPNRAKCRECGEEWKV